MAELSITLSLIAITGVVITWIRLSVDQECWQHTSNLANTVLARQERDHTQMQRQIEHLAKKRSSDLDNADKRFKAHARKISELGFYSRGQDRRIKEMVKRSPSSMRITFEPDTPATATPPEDQPNAKC